MSLMYISVVTLELRLFERGNAGLVVMLKGDFTTPDISPDVRLNINAVMHFYGTRQALLSLCVDL